MFSDPQFWVAVSFVLFVAAIFNPVRKVLTSNLDSQIKEIQNTINNAETLKNEAQKTLSELVTKEADVAKEIKQLKDKADERIRLLQQNLQNKLKEQIEKKKEQSENKIDKIIRDTNANLRDYITTSTSNATKYILDKNLTEKDRKNLINSSIEQLNKIIKN